MVDQASLRRSRKSCDSVVSRPSFCSMRIAVLDLLRRCTCGDPACYWEREQRRETLDNLVLALMHPPPPFLFFVCEGQCERAEKQNKWWCHKTWKEIRAIRPGIRRNEKKTYPHRSKVAVCVRHDFWWWKLKGLKLKKRGFSLPAGWLIMHEPLEGRLDN